MVHTAWYVLLSLLSYADAHSVLQVNQKDLWPVIGAKLGFVNFPGTETEPGRAGPALAAHLEHIYKEFLLDFDQQYLKQLVQHRRQQMQQQVQQQKMAAAMDMSQPNGGSVPQSVADIKDPKLIGELVSYSASSAAELQQRGVPLHIIQLVENNRERLKSMLETQRNFSRGLQNAREQGAAQVQRNVSNPMGNGPQGSNPPPMNVPNGAAQHQKYMPLQTQLITMPSSYTMGPNGQPGQPQQPQQQMGPNARPTAAQMQNAVETVKRIKEENKSESF